MDVADELAGAKASLYVQKLGKILHLSQVGLYQTHNDEKKLFNAMVQCQIFIRSEPKICMTQGNSNTRERGATITVQNNYEFDHKQVPVYIYAKQEVWHDPSKYDAIVNYMFL